MMACVCGTGGKSSAALTARRQPQRPGPSYKPYRKHALRCCGRRGRGRQTRLLLGCAEAVLWAPARRLHTNVSARHSTQHNHNSVQVQAPLVQHVRALRQHLKRWQRGWWTTLPQLGARGCQSQRGRRRCCCRGLYWILVVNRKALTCCRGLSCRGHCVRWGLRGRMRLSRGGTKGKAVLSWKGKRGNDLRLQVRPRRVGGWRERRQWRLGQRRGRL